MEFCIPRYSLGGAWLAFTSWKPCLFESETSCGLEIFSSYGDVLDFNLALIYWLAISITSCCCHVHFTSLISKIRRDSLSLYFFTLFCQFLVHALCQIYALQISVVSIQKGHKSADLDILSKIIFHRYGLWHLTLCLISVSFLQSQEPTHIILFLWCINCVSCQFICNFCSYSRLDIKNVPNYFSCFLWKWID